MMHMQNNVISEMSKQLDVILKYFLILLQYIKQKKKKNFFLSCLKYAIYKGEC